MELQPGEAAVLIVRRSKDEPAKYFCAVRTSMNSKFDSGNDFEIGSPQKSIVHTWESPAIGTLLDQAIEGLKKILV